MLKHYLSVALRSFLRHRTHTVVSVAVLALGLVGFITAYLVVSYLRGYDRHFANADRIQVIFHGTQNAVVSTPPYPSTSRLLAEQLRLDVPELEAVARYRPTVQAFVTVGGESQRRRIAYAEPQFLEIFDFEAVAGDLRDVFALPQNAVITARAAENLFGTRDSIGRVVTVTERSSLDVRIAAVIADLPPTSHLGQGLMSAAGFELLLPWDAGETLAPPRPFEANWFFPTTATYALLPRDGSLTAAELDLRLADLVRRHVPDQDTRLTLRARNVSTIAGAELQRQFEGFLGTAWRFDVLTWLLAFAGVILVVACVNFVNLAVARAVGRARDVGIRKAVGAGTAQLIAQDLVQTGVVAAAAVLVALGTVVALAPIIQSPWQRTFEVPWTDPRFSAFLAITLFATTVLAGLYPALILSRIRVLAALRLGTAIRSSRALRTALVGAQFAVASFLIVAVVVLFAQRHSMRDALLGRFADQYVVVMPLGLAGVAEPDPDVLEAELTKDPSIKGVTRAPPPFASFGGRQQLSRSPGSDGVPVMTDMQSVGYDYFAVMEQPLVAGRVFSRDRAVAAPLSTQEAPARPSFAVLDQDAARALGWADAADAVGEIVYLVIGPQSAPWEVIGVVESVPRAVRERNTTGVLYISSPRASMPHIIRIGTDDIVRSLAHIDNVFKTLDANRPPRNRFFLGQTFENAYSAFALANFVFAALGAVAVAIAAAGLFGLASYMTARRTREIGLRKSQGASSAQILRLLLGEFARPVVIANVAVWPIAFIAANRYLGLFAERITLTPAPFAFALVATLAVAWLAVARRVLHAARAPPVEALREQ